MAEDPDTLFVSMSEKTAVRMRSSREIIFEGIHSAKTADSSNFLASTTNLLAPPLDSHMLPYFSPKNTVVGLEKLLLKQELRELHATPNSRMLHTQLGTEVVVP